MTVSITGFSQTTYKRIVKGNVAFDSSQGISVKKDQEIEITASGKWTKGVGTRPWVNADGYGGWVWMRFQVRIGSHTIDVGKYKKFKSPATGTMLFGNDDHNLSDNGGSLNVTISIQGLTKKVSLPGIPSKKVNPGSKVRGIKGFPLVEEDKSYTWSGNGLTEVYLAPGSRISYTFTFDDPYDPVPVKGSFDPFKVSDVLKKIKAAHIYKESGASYNINLKLVFMKRSFQGNGQFIDIPTSHSAGPFKVVVVDHLPEYIGDLFFFIMGPKNTTGRKKAEELKRTSTIFEDPDPTRTRFFISALINLFTELPPGMNTGDNPDRFSGIDPSSVRYRLDFGDGSARSDWIPFAEVNAASPKSLKESLEKSLFESESWSHDYSEPGEYIMKVTMTFRLVKYKNVQLNGTTYTFKKHMTDYEYQTMSRKIRVVDRTPPRISITEMVELKGTTGDPLRVQFEVEDNNQYAEMSSGILKVEKHDKKGKYDQYPLKIENIGASQLRGLRYLLTGIINMPGDFAHKDSLPPLDYKLILTDAEGNKNSCITSITEDDPPHYGAKTGNGEPVDETVGRLFVFDNDPPSGELKIFRNSKLISQMLFEEAVNDEMENEVMLPEKLTVTNKGTNKTWNVNDPEKNPFSESDIPTGIIIRETIAEIPEDVRVKIQLTTSDNVDSDGASGHMLMNGREVKLIKGKAEKSLIFSRSGEQNLVLELTDLPNINKTSSRRKILFPVRILDSKLDFRTLNKGTR